MSKKSQGAGYPQIIEPEAPVELLAGLLDQFLDTSVEGDTAPSSGVRRTDSRWLVIARLAAIELERQEWIDWPSPEAWYARSRAALERCRPWQWQALTLLYGRGPREGGVQAPPARPEDLRPEHFIKWSRLGEYLQRAGQQDVKAGDPEVLIYETQEGETRGVLAWSGVEAAQGDAQPTVLHLIKELAEQITSETGLRPGQSLPFLLCDAPVRVARIGFATEVSQRLGYSIQVRLVDHEVSADELRYAYRAFQKYLESLSPEQRPSGSDFEKFVAGMDLRGRGARPTDRTLLSGTQDLVAFVDELRGRGSAWQEVFEKWNEDHSDRPMASLKSFQANFYQARRRLKQKAPALERVQSDDRYDSVTEGGARDE